MEPPTLEVHPIGGSRQPIDWSWLWEPDEPAPYYAMSVAEIARELGVKRHVVEYTIDRALHKLRLELGIPSKSRYGYTPGPEVARPMTQPRVCAACEREFIPTTGIQKVCLDCKAAVDRARKNEWQRRKRKEKASGQAHPQAGGRP